MALEVIDVSTDVASHELDLARVDVDADEAVSKRRNSEQLVASAVRDRGDSDDGIEIGQMFLRTPIWTTAGSPSRLN